MQFEMIRWLLFQRKQADVFEQRNPDGSIPTREEWLRRALKEPIEFPHRTDTFYFVPAETTNARFIIGRIGRKLYVKENEPPQMGLKETARDQWQAVDVLIDPTTHSDGQKIAIEVNKKVGTPLSLMQSLADHLNHSFPPSPYTIDTNTILDPRSFMEFVRAHRGEIVCVTFELVAPNMFGIRDDIDREMDELKHNENVRTAKLTLQNEDGLKLDTIRVEQTANHAAEGGGSIKARTKTGQRFNSKNKGVRVTMPNDETNGASWPTLIERIIQRVFNQ